jgi:hypothetical protein
MGRALWLGRGVHVAVAEYHCGQRHAVDAFTSWAEQEIRRVQGELGETWSLTDEERYSELVELGTQMLLYYETYDREHQDFSYVAAEREFAVQIPQTDGWFVGTFDGIVRDGNGRYWVVEHKTAATFPSTEWLLMQPQTVGYVYAARALAAAGVLPNVPKGAYIEGAIYNGILKRVPQFPQQLKSGQISRAANALAGTTYKLYRDALVQYGLSARDYEQELLFLYNRLDPFIKREWVRRSDEELRIFMQQVRMQYLEIQRAANPSTSAQSNCYPTPAMDCAYMCAFTSPCLGMQTGGDVTLELQSNYVERPPRGAVYADWDSGS